MTAEAARAFEQLPFVIRARVTQLFQRLAAWPNVRGAKPLRGKWKGHFRLRTGDWWVIVRPVGAVLWVIRIDNRRDVYGD